MSMEILTEWPAFRENNKYDVAAVEEIILPSKIRITHLNAEEVSSIPARLLIA